MDWADAKPHIAKKIAIRIANRHEIHCRRMFFVPRPLSFLFHWKDFKAPLQLHDETKSKVCPLHVRQVPKP
jgi:hypothetical protein